MDRTCNRKRWSFLRREKGGGPAAFLEIWRGNGGWIEVMLGLKQVISAVMGQRAARIGRVQGIKGKKYLQK